jgi:alpha-glucosidase
LRAETGPHRPWWESAVIYQIYPRSFCDGDGDGVGDLEGIRAHLDHLSWLGVDALWLSPFFPSPMADFGYDVADYTGVDPLFGDLAAFDRLVADGHERGLKVLIDWVPNHSSDQHPWFQASRSSPSDPRRHWYWWRDDRPDAAGGSGPPGSPGRAPNNWLAAFPGVGGTDLPSAWTWDEGTGQWYLHLFLPGQPDLNWAHPEVRAAMEDVLRFWMERGVDGFRVDVAHGLGKDPALPDLPSELRALPAASVNDDPATHPILAGLRSVVDAWPSPPARMMVGEVYLPTTAQVSRYYGTPAYPELHLSFNFPPLFAPWDAAAWKACIDEVTARLDPAGAWPTWVLSNHDQPRHGTRYGSEAVARAAAVLLLTLRGTPFLYAGEELGLADAVVGPEQRVDPGGRDGCRAPIPWDPTPGHGWAGGPDPWLPWPPEADSGRTVAQLAADPASILHLYRRLLGARRASPALRAGHFRWHPQASGLLCYERAAGDDRRGQDRRGRDRRGRDRRLVAINFTPERREMAVPDGAWVVEVASDGLEPGGGPGSTLAGHQALLLRPGAS